MGRSLCEPCKPPIFGAVTSDEVVSGTLHRPIYLYCIMQNAERYHKMNTGLLFELLNETPTSVGFPVKVKCGIQAGISCWGNG